MQDMKALLHDAATPIKELYQLGLYAEVQEYGDRTHDAIIELYDTHRKEIERGRRAGSKKAKRALSRYVIETLQGRTADDVSHGYFDRASQLRLAYEDEARHETTSRVTTERDFFDTKSLFAHAKGHRPPATFREQSTFEPAKPGDDSLAEDEQGLDHISDQSINRPELWTVAKGLARAVLTGATRAAGNPGSNTVTSTDDMLENTHLF